MPVIHPDTSLLVALKVRHDTFHELALGSGGPLLLRLEPAFVFG
jgi:hypothetical protein